MPLPSPTSKPDFDTRLGLMRRYVDALRQAVAHEQDAFIEDLQSLGAAKHYLTTSMLCCLDLANRIIAVRGLPLARAPMEVFSILLDAGHLEPEMVDDLHQMDALRYRITQIYWDVDDVEVHTIARRGLPVYDRYLDRLASLWPAEVAEGAA